MDEIKITLPELIKMAKNYYSMPENSCGGSLHIVLDDGNLKDYHIAHCLEYATSKGDMEGIELAKMLLKASQAQRSGLYKSYSLYCS